MSEKRQKVGFTLFELLVAMGIALALIAIIMSAGKSTRQSAKKRRAEAMIGALEIAIGMYQADTGAYPTGDGNGCADMYDYLTNEAYGGGVKPGWIGPYMEFKDDEISGGQVMDPWGTAYNYDATTPPALNNTASFDLWSAGPDRNGGNLDDITNW